MLSVELQGGEPFQLTLPMSAASSPLELKQAIAVACLANLGMEVTPESWQEDEELDDMAVQLMDAKVRRHIAPPRPHSGTARARSPPTLSNPTPPHSEQRTRQAQGDTLTDTTDFDLVLGCEAPCRAETGARHAELSIEE